MSGSGKVNWEKYNRKRKADKSIKEETRLERNYKKVIQDPTLKMEVASLRRFKAKQERLIEARGRPHVGVLTAIYTDKGTRIKLPSIAAKFILWREENK